MVFVGGLTGSFFRPLALAYALAVLASMLVALTVTPALAMVLMPSARLGTGDPVLIAWCKRGYARLLAPVLRARNLALFTVLVAIAAAALVAPRLGQDLFPSFKEPDLLMHFDTKPGTSLPEMKRIVARLQRRLLRPSPASRTSGPTSGRPCSGRRSRARVLRAVDQRFRRMPTWPRRRRLSGAVAASFPGTFPDVTTYLHERIDETLVLLELRSRHADLRARFRNLAAAGSRRSPDRLSGTPNLVDLHPRPRATSPRFRRR